MRSLGMNDDATLEMNDDATIDASEGKLSEKESEEKGLRNLNSCEPQSSGAEVESISKKVESRENACA